jgi:hypothetical protein
MPPLGHFLPPLPTLPRWPSPDLAAPVRLEVSYLTACRSLRISA